MGKWIYINLLVLLASIVCMYLQFNTFYQPPLQVYVLSTLAWVTLYGLGHYIFIHKVQKTRQSPASATSLPVNASAKNERPKVVLKTERPKVALKKKNDRHHGKS